MNKGGRSFITNGILICAVAAFLCVYFSVNSLWNAGTIVVISLVLLLGCFYFWLYYNFFNKKG